MHLMKKKSQRENSYTKIIVLALIIVSLSFSFGKISVAKAAPMNQQSLPVSQTGVFSQAPCWTEIPPQFANLVICGYVSVPERHENPDGPKIRLAVMVIKSNEPETYPDPLFFLQGGPGASTIDTYADILLKTPPLLSDRDIVLFDQRGTFYSQPSLACSELDQLLLDTIEKDIPDEEYIAMRADAFRVCRQRLINQGIDLSAYNSIENAADIQTIRQALGYEEINLYGVSYGSLLALHTMRFYPENLRSVVLDAVVPPQTDFLVEAPQTSQRAFTYLFDICQQDQVCSKAYPDLLNRFFQLVDALNQTPVHIPMTDPDSGITYQALLDGDTFLDGVFQFLYIGDLIPAIPMMIADAENGDFNFFAKILSLLVFDRTYSYGMYFSVLCSEDADFTPEDVSLSDILPQLAEAQAEDAEIFLSTCELWQVKPLDPVMDDPVQSQLPVLIMSGGFDPITPAENGREVSQTLPNSYTIEFPTGGHGALLSGDCQDQILREFLERPDQAPDASCIPPISEMKFFTPKTVIKIPAIIQLLNLENNREIEFLLLLFSAVFLLPAIILVPGRWLWTLYREETQIILPNPVSDGRIYSNRLAASTTIQPSNKNGNRGELISSSWLIWFFSLVTWLFLISFFTIVVLMVANNDSRLYFGLPGQARFLFVLPLMMLLTMVALVIAIVRKCFFSKKGLFEKLVVTFSGILCGFILIILVRWDILFAIINQ